MTGSNLVDKSERSNSEGLPKFQIRQTVVSGHTFSISNRYDFTGCRILGRGSYGVVSQAIDLVTNKKLAIKRIRPYANDEWDARHTLREIRLMKLLSAHPNVVTLYELSLFEEKMELYMVMELMDCDLHHIIQSKQPLTEMHYKCFARQMLEGVRAMHSIGVFHRDMKPGNLLVSKDCQLRITDFGLARYMDQETLQGNNTQNPLTEYVVTRWYRCPELLLSPNKPYTGAIDIWSIGCIMAELIRRRPLFPGKSHANQVQLIFEVMGFNNVNELGFPVSAEAAAFLNKRCRFVRQDLWDILPEASEEAIIFIDELLDVNPRHRPTALEALDLPYVADADVLCDYSNCRLEPPRPGMFRFESTKMNLDELKAEVHSEVFSAGPTMTAADTRHTSNTSSTNARSTSSYPTVPVPTVTDDGMSSKVVGSGTSRKTDSEQGLADTRSAIHERDVCSAPSGLSYRTGTAVNATTGALPTASHTSINAAFIANSDNIYGRSFSAGTVSDTVASSLSADIDYSENTDSTMNINNSRSQSVSFSESSQRSDRDISAFSSKYAGPMAARHPNEEPSLGPKKVKQGYMASSAFPAISDKSIGSSHSSRRPEGTACASDPQKSYTSVSSTRTHTVKTAEERAALRMQYDAKAAAQFQPTTTVNNQSSHNRTSTVTSNSSILYTETTSWRSEPKEVQGLAAVSEEEEDKYAPGLSMSQSHAPVQSQTQTDQWSSRFNITRNKSSNSQHGSDSADTSDSVTSVGSGKERTNGAISGTATSASTGSGGRFFLQALRSTLNLRPGSANVVVPASTHSQPTAEQPSDPDSTDAWSAREPRPSTSKRSSGLSSMLAGLTLRRSQKVDHSMDSVSDVLQSINSTSGDLQHPIPESVSSTQRVASPEVANESFASTRPSAQTSLSAKSFHQSATATTLKATDNSTNSIESPHLPQSSTSPNHSSYIDAATVSGSDAMLRRKKLPHPVPTELPKLPLSNAAVATSVSSKVLDFEKSLCPNGSTSEKRYGHPMGGRLTPIERKQTVMLSTSTTARDMREGDGMSPLDRDNGSSKLRPLTDRERGSGATFTSVSSKSRSAGSRRDITALHGASSQNQSTRTTELDGNGYPHGHGPMLSSMAIDWDEPSANTCTGVGNGGTKTTPVKGLPLPPGGRLEPLPIPLPMAQANR